jgi:hypothetical protein
LPSYRTEEGMGIVGLERCEQLDIKNGIKVFVKFPSMYSTSGVWQLLFHFPWMILSLIKM